MTLEYLPGNQRVSPARPPDAPVADGMGQLCLAVYAQARWQFEDGRYATREALIFDATPWRQWDEGERRALARGLPPPWHPAPAWA